MVFRCLLGAAACLAFAAPAHATTFVVTSEQSAGANTLRQAILDANDTPVRDEIQFNLTARQINLDSPLPAITAPLVIDGATNPGHVDNTDPAGFNATLSFLVFNPSGNASPGLDVRSDDVTINAMWFEDFSPAVRVTSGRNTSITGSVLGDTGGSYPLAELSPVVDVAGGSDATIGGLAIKDTNNLVGGSIGVRTAAAGTDVIGNIIAAHFIGVDLAPATRDSTVELNLVGPSGFYGGNSTGVRVRGSDNLVTDNAVYGSRGPGVAVVSGAGNEIRGTEFEDNGGLGIDLDAPGVLPNDPLDVDTGPNGLQNYPVLTSAVTSAGVTTVSGTFDGAPGTQVAVDLFASEACDPSGNGEGERFVGSTTSTTDTSGHASTSVSISAVADRTAFAATATTADGTSEFSKCVLAGPPPPAATATPVPAPVRDTTAPVLSRLSVKPKTFTVRRGTTIALRSSEPARLEIRIGRLDRGRRVGKRCLPDSRARKRRRACQRLVAIGVIRRDAVAGENRIRFTGTVGTRKLRPGTYQATVVATDPSGNVGAPSTATFRVSG
ncbi:right-handed parallel beta-helix repeat-containing protein [Solirubrobacter soli]|uniref:right-handed parallel beta-helix repeat-containing protein n=1 Tax=Solirubrobacter soli TaxID=363832 RepID=UPI000400D761|nr:right-handed parallel beta-helix repeat-containing protein [Solirubrobacter soli]